MQRDDPDEFPLPCCAHCGERLLEGNYHECPNCRAPICDWCHEDQEDE